MIFLGGKEKTTLKDLSGTLGKETIDLYNTSENRSNQKRFGLNHQKTSNDLIRMKLLLSDKYDITKHKSYKLLEDYDKRNACDVQ